MKSAFGSGLRVIRRAHCERNDANCGLVLESFGNVLSNAFVAMHLVSGSNGSSAIFKMNSASSRKATFRLVEGRGSKARIIWRIGNASTDPFDTQRAAIMTVPVKCVD